MTRVKILGDPQGHPSQTYPSGPDPLQTAPPGPDLDLIWNRKRRFQVKIRPKSGLGRGVRRGSGPKGRSSSPRRKVLKLEKN